MSEAASPGRRSPRGMLGLMGGFFRSTDGISATEFALLAPVLVLGAFSTADAGRAIYERMMIGQTLRAAAQLAMTGAPQDEIRTVLEEVASQNFTIAADGSAAGNALAIGVSPYCGCPGDTVVQVNCTVVCASGIRPTEFVRLTASKTFDGVILPDFGLAGSLDVVAE